MDEKKNGEDKIILIDQFCKKKINSPVKNKTMNLEFFFYLLEAAAVVADVSREEIILSVAAARI